MKIHKISGDELPFNSFLLTCYGMTQAFPVQMSVNTALYTVRSCSSSMISPQR